MSFIELTLVKTGRTIYVCASAIAYVVRYVNDDEGEQCTHVAITGDEDFLAVVESPEEVLRRIGNLST